MANDPRQQRLLQDLVVAVNEVIGTHPTRERTSTAIEGLLLSRSTREKKSAQLVLRQPALCLTMQGAKWALSGNQRHDYSARRALAVTMAAPARSAISSATAASPYLGIMFPLDLKALQEVAQEALCDKKDQALSPDRLQSIFAMSLSSELLDCALRAIRLLKTPDAIPVLYPGLMRDMAYWLICSPEGDQFVHMARQHIHDPRIHPVILHMQQEFKGKLLTEELASLAGMSAVTFRRKFKDVTSTTPLQYQKQLRLLEGRRLMILARAGMEQAAYEVGYESASHFSRDYTRAFGRSPRYDLSRWQ